MKLLEGFSSYFKSFSLFLFFYLIATISLYFYIYANKTTYDGGILDGIFVPVLVYIIISVIALVLIKDIKKVVFIGGLFLGSLNIIPALKYSLFYNTFDGPAHYRFAEQIALTGHVPYAEFYSVSYGTNPGRHIFVASLSMVFGISVNDALKFFVPVLFGLIPFLIYFIGRNFHRL